MRALAVMLLLTSCATPLPSSCFEEATEGECVVWENPVSLPPTNAEEEQLVLAACRAPCVVAQREVKLARSSAVPQAVPLLKKLRFPFALQATEADEGVDLEVGPVPGLAFMDVVGATSLQSLKGLDAPRLTAVKVYRSPSVQSLEGVPSHILSLGLRDLELSELTGLSALSSLGGLELMRLPKLGKVTHLDNLIDIGSLIIDETGLTSLAGFNPDLKVTGGYIQSNASLSNCEAEEFAARVEKRPVGPGGGLRVAGNGPCP